MGLIFSSFATLVFDPSLWLVMLAAVPMGMIFGAVPGLGGKLGIVLSIPLVSDRHAVGSINLYSRRRDAFTDDDPDRISDLVAYAVHLVTVSPLYEASVDTLARVVEVVRQAAQVEIAVGMLIVSAGLTPAEAWDHLHAQAAEHGTSIVEHAQHLIDLHERGLGRPEDPTDG